VTLAVGVGGERHGHAGEHDDIVQGNEFEGCHGTDSTLNT
jgi:hypothetical protein